MASTIVPSQLFEHSILGWTLRGSQLVHSKRKCVGIKSKLTELILCNFQMKSSMCHAHPTRSSDASYKILQAQLEGIDGGSDEQWTWLAGVVPSRDAGTRSPAMCGLQLRPVEWRLMQIEETSQMPLNASKCWGWETPFLLGRAGFRGYRLY